MKFESEEDKILFIKGTPYFKSLDNFCVGSTLDDAGTIAKIVNQARLQKERLEGEKNEKRDGDWR